MFTSIVVPLDLCEGDRALSVAASLSKAARIRATLLTVSSPGLPREVDEYELHTRAAKYGLTAANLVSLQGDDPADAIARYMWGMNHASLLVMATGARGPLGRRVFGSVSEDVLARLGGPALLIGPSVPDNVTLSSPELIVAVADADHSADVSDAVATWTSTFPGPPPTVVEVVETPVRVGGDPGSELARNHAAAVVAELGARGVEATTKVLHGGEPVFWLNEYAASVNDGVLVAASHQWTDGHVHLHSTTRKLVHLASRPVLVVPV